MPLFKIKNTDGFTLSELLIALAILGVLATFVIPKILTGQANSQKFAVLKESISAYSEATYMGHIQGKFVQNGGSCGGGLYDMTYIRNEAINYIRLCGNAEGDGCYAEAVNACAGGAGHILANGSSTCGVGTCTGSSTPQDTIFLDWDGPDNGNNTQGDDQIRLVLCFAEGCTNGLRPGEVKPSGATSIAFYEEIFSTK